MKKVLVLLVPVVLVQARIPAPGSREVLQKMHDLYYGKWYTTRSFGQVTGIYRHDSLVQTQYWHEHIKLPGLLRIDFGKPDSGNAVIFRDDSSYVFRRFRKVAVRPYDGDLMLMLGDMYFYSVDSVMRQFQTYGYDLTKCHEDTWNGQGVYVLGASRGEDSVNQVWVEKTHYTVVRFIRQDAGTREEGRFEQYVPLGGGYSETLVHFYINDHLVQTEQYEHLSAGEPMDDSLFDTRKLVNWMP